MFETKHTHLSYDIDLLIEDSKGMNESTEDMWYRLISDHSFLILNESVPTFLCFFGSTYVCEITFSYLTRRKSKYRGCLNQNRLESEIRCEITDDCKPDFSALIENEQCHSSH